MTRDPHATIPTAAALSEEEQNRLAQILDDYLVAVERGTPIAPADLLARHPAEAQYLQLYLSGLQLFHAAATGAGGRSSGAQPGLPEVSARTAGKMIGEFAILREIGRGGMGVVYEAEQTSLRRRVALKVLPLSAAGDAKQLGRFKNEAQAAAQVQHPNIVPVFAVGESDGVHYFAMQLIEGQSLAHLLAGVQGDSQRPDNDATTLPNATRTWSGAKLPTPVSTSALTATPAMPAALNVTAIAQFGRQAAEALHAAHQYGIIHRDVKPSNLLVDRQGKLWVADFGLARRREGSDLTRTGDVCGTMRYMSPEQATGQASLVDHRTDVYSLGVTLYELAAGRHPAEEVGDARRLVDPGNFTGKPLRHWNRRIAVDFETIVMKSMAELPGDRYASAQGMADDLGRFLAGEAIFATPPTRLTRVRKWAARHKKSVASVACLLVVGMALTTASLGYVAGARVERDQATAEAFENSQAFGKLLYDVPLRTAEQLAAIPGTDGVRRQLLEESLKYYTRLAEQAFGDTALGADLALAYSKIGSLAAVMGDHKRALQAHREARRILDGLVAQEPDNAEYARSLALCRNNAGLMLAELGSTDEALVELAAARTIQESLRQQRPQWREIVTDLAATYGNLGLTTKQRGERDAAGKWFRAAIALQEKLVPPTTSDDDQPLLRALAASYNNLGSLNEAAGGAAAINAYQRAIDLQRSLVASQPINQDFQAELARSYSNLGYAAASDKDWPTAQRAYNNAVQLQENLVKQSPLALAYHRDRAITYNNLGMALCEIGRLDEAGEAFQRALADQRPLVKARPGDAATLSHLGGIYNNFGMLLDRRDQQADAADAYRQAIRNQRQALELQPQHDATRELLSKHYDNFAKTLQRQGKLAEARSAAQERTKLWGDQPERQAAASRDVAQIEELMAASNATDERVESSGVN